MSTKDRSGCWVIPQEQADELMGCRINFTKLVQDCLQPRAVPSVKPRRSKVKYGRKSELKTNYGVQDEVKLEIGEEVEIELDVEEEKKKGFLHRDIRTFLSK